VSVGGNDALDQLGVLQDRTNSIAAALDRLATIREGFEADYCSMLERVLARGLPTAICTIYYPRFPEPAMQRLPITGLTIFNDCILLEALARPGGDLIYSRRLRPTRRWNWFILS
jgi:hypothetical protein